MLTENNFLEKFKNIDDIFLFLIFSNSYQESTWIGRIQLLFYSLTPSLIYLHKEGKLVLNSDTFKRYLNLEMMLELYNRTDLPINHKTSLSNYLDILPGFNYQTPYQLETTITNHGYVSTGITTFFDQLKYIENEDPVLISREFTENFFITKKLNDYCPLGIKLNTIESIFFKHFVLSHFNNKTNKKLHLSDFIVFFISKPNVDQIQFLKRIIHHLKFK